MLLRPRGGEAKGIELSANGEVAGDWNVSGSYPFSRVSDDLSSQDVLRSWDQTHAFNAQVSWRHAGTAAFLVLSWHSGRPTTPIALVGTQSPFLQIGAPDSSRWGHYLSVDLRLARTVSLPLRDLDLAGEGSALRVTPRMSQAAFEMVRRKISGAYR